MHIYVLLIWLQPFGLGYFRNPFVALKETFKTYYAPNMDDFWYFVNEFVHFHGFQIWLRNPRNRQTHSQKNWKYSIWEHNLRISVVTNWRVSTNSISRPNFVVIRIVEHIERWNSKGRSGTILTNFSKKSFAAFLQWHPEAIHIWLTHQSKALIFYFDMRKKLISYFENFVGNRQTKFHEFKLRVCVNTF